MIIPSIDLMNGHAVQLVGGDAERKQIDAGDPHPIAERFRLAGEIAVIDLDAALGKGDNADAIPSLLRAARCRVGGGIRSVDAALTWLDAGAHTVILGTAATPDVLGELPVERVQAALDARHGDVVTHGWTTRTGARIDERMRELGGLVGGFLVTFVEREGRMEGIDLAEVERLANIAREHGCRLTVAGGVTTAAELAAIDAMGADAQVGMAIYTGKLGLGEAVAAAVRTDAAIPCVIADRFGVSLRISMLARGDIARMIDTRELDGVGVREIAFDDCRSCARVTVDAGLQSVWANRHGVTALAQTLAGRKEDAPEGSYTRRLFEDAELRAAKLREEAEELLSAVTRDESAWEAADVIYFALVDAIAKGADLEAIEAELDLRSRRVRRRRGDAKPRAASGIGDGGSA